jgi:predicted MPP superfamily phosphohydrolase
VLTLILTRLFFFALFVLAVYGVQQFWFGRAWRSLGWLKNGRWRFGLRAGLIALAAVLVATLIDPLVVRGAARLGLGGVRFGRLTLSSLTPGNTLFTFSRLWVLTSFFAFIAVKSVGAIEWVANAAARLRLHLRHKVGAGAGAGEINASRRTFFQYAACVAGSVPFLAATYGFADERLRLTIDRVEAPVANLPPELDGLRIAQLSDIHIGDYMPAREIARAVAMANGLQPDLTVVTGDFISSDNDPLEACITELSRLRAPLGVWGCNGNHEAYAELEDEAERLFREKGMRLLRAASAVVEHKGARFNLLGVDYQSDHPGRDEAPGPKLREIEALVRRDMPNFLLSHNPNSFHRAAELGIELSLAGHTHGGQVKFEIVDHSVSPARLFTPFVAGLYRLPLYRPADRLAMTGVAGSEHAALYVNRGLGTIGFPVRLGSPPEITLLTLRRA